MMRRNDLRARNHPAWWAFLVHRLSGLALAIFLPLHFLALAMALRGPAGLDPFLRVTDRPLFKFAEWGLVVLLSLHMAGGVRLLLIEFRPWSGLRMNWIAGACAFGFAVSVVYALALVS